MIDIRQELEAYKKKYISTVCELKEERRSSEKLKEKLDTLSKSNKEISECRHVEKGSEITKSMKTNERFTLVGCKDGTIEEHEKKTLGLRGKRGGCTHTHCLYRKQEKR